LRNSGIWLHSWPPSSPEGKGARPGGARGMKDVFQYTSLGIFCKGFGGHGITADQVPPRLGAGRRSFRLSRQIPISINYKTEIGKIQFRWGTAPPAVLEKGW
jgi:hypothetical protein